MQMPPSTHWLVDATIVAGLWCIVVILGALALVIALGMRC